MLELNNRPVAYVDSNAWKMMDTSYIYKCVHPSVMIILSNWSIQVSLLSLNNNLLEIYFPIVCVGLLRSQPSGNTSSSYPFISIKITYISKITYLEGMHIIIMKTVLLNSVRIRLNEPF